MAHDPSAFIQEYFRIRSADDTALNTDSGWAAAENIDASIATGIHFRIRFKVRETAAGTDSTGFKLQCNRESAGWVDVDDYDGAVSNAAQGVISVQFTNGASATELLTNTGTYVNGEGRHTSPSGSFTLTSEETELEFAIMIMSWHDGPTQNIATDTIEFRVVESDGTAFGGTYTNPTITVTETAGYVGGTFVEHAHQIGPMIDANGNIYAIIEAAHTQNAPIMIKSTDGGDTWRGPDIANGPTEADAEGISIFKVGDTLHILHCRSNIFYHRFRMSDHATPDDWEIIDETVDTVGGHSTQYGSLIVRSDGTIVAFYHDNASPSRCWYNIRNGTWGTPVEIDTEASTDFISANAVLAESDKIYVVYKDDTNGEIWVRDLNSSDTLSGRTSVISGIEASSNADNIPYLSLVYYDSGGEEKVMVIYAKIEGADPLYHKVLTDGSLGSEVLVTDLDVEMNEAGNHMPIADAEVHGTEVVIAYAEKANYDIMTVINDDEGGWGTETEDLDVDETENEANFLSGNVITHSVGNGGDTVFGYFLDLPRLYSSTGATGYIQYREILIEAGGGVTISLDTAAVTANGQVLGLAPGAVSKLLDTASITAGGQALSLAPGQATTALDTASVTAAGQVLSLAMGAASIGLNTAVITAAGQTLSLQMGAVTISLSTSLLTASGQDIQINYAVNAATAQLTAGGQTLGVVPGAVTLGLSTAVITANGQVIVISLANIILLSTASLVAGGQTLSLAPGEATTGLNTAVVTANGQVLNLAPGEATTLLNSAVVAANGQALSLSLGEAITLLNSASVIANGQALTLAPGEAITGLSTAMVTANGQVITLVVSGAPITISASTAALVAGGQSVSLVMGAVSTALATAALTANGQVITVILAGAPVTIPLSTATITAGGQSSTIVPGAATVALNTALATALGQSLGVSPGAVTIALLTAALASNGQSVTLAPGAVSLLLDTPNITAGGQSTAVVPGAVSVPLNSAGLTALGQALVIIAVGFPGRAVVLDVGFGLSVVSDEAVDGAAVSDAKRGDAVIQDSDNG